MRNVLILSPGNDTAGIGIGLKRAFDRHGGEWHARHVCRSLSRFQYPTDMVWPIGDNRSGAKVSRLFAQADVIHIMEVPDIALLFAGHEHKSIIVHHLGTYFRRDPGLVSALCQGLGATEVAGSHDLRLLPHLGWLPVSVDIDSIAELRRRTYRSGPVRIAHAPTHRVLKSTEVIRGVVEQLAREYPITFDLIEDVPWRECLARKAQADIFVDELTLGYGVNALEAWAMGIPVVSGLADERIRAAMLADFGSFPFVDVTAETLHAELARLIRVPELRSEWGQRGLEHARRWHAESVVVERAVGLYEQALERRAVAA